ncbi:MAG: hypothetical protein TE42_06910 [Candidatus Synechococcus spongiarum SP3]|uniref:Uncharacterized protein n=1 Tax=Candidatus Synechococcus spongiarum SP3 TaxID=1604020 RepID=A0A0G2J4L5_9SYNE|nr:MAG: hypothetical protein TE42_06910 [Candidatus Synechococcus spongiarum SP3]
MAPLLPQQLSGEPEAMASSMSAVWRGLTTSWEKGKIPLSLKSLASRSISVGSLVSLFLAG